MATQQTRWRQLHRTLAPIMVLPILLTLITGSLFQIADLAGQKNNFRLLLALHKGHWRILHVEAMYPFLNALGLLVMAVTGIGMCLPFPSAKYS
ncbi:MAG: PepSY domain-containing protein [Rhizonema sp. PD37]|nr:PepSY domain-containing protein [Rhizonema sp. PD37]